jgi:SAM-dependent methyltransferase
MQAYGKVFARVYDAKWSGFAKQVAPPLLDFYATTAAGRKNRLVLDLCCGTGHLALHFLERGYKVVGIDLSEHMLHFAQEKTGGYIESGQARFVRCDASDFTLEERFGLVVSTYDSINHLENEERLRRCLRCVRAVSKGLFIFDLNTRNGLRRWNGIQVDESSEDALIVNRGIYDEQGGRAWTRISGFFRMPDGLYERFEETVFNTIFTMETVRKALLDAGWRNVHFARIQDLSTPVAEPEKEGRVFVVAS